MGKIIHYEVAPTRSGDELGLLCNLCEFPINGSFFRISPKKKPTCKVCLEYEEIFKNE